MTSCSNVFDSNFCLLVVAPFLNSISSSNGAACHNILIKAIDQGTIPILVWLKSKNIIFINEIVDYVYRSGHPDAIKWFKKEGYPELNDDMVMSDEDI